MLRPVILADEPWPSFLWRNVVYAAYRMYHYADYAGGYLAYLFGYNSPKYQYVLDEVERQRVEDAAEAAEFERQVDEAEREAVAVTGASPRAEESLV